MGCDVIPVPSHVQLGGNLPFSPFQFWVDVSFSRWPFAAHQGRSLRKNCLSGFSDCGFGVWKTAFDQLILPGFEWLALNLLPLG
jgi:hypothetical protein